MQLYVFNAGDEDVKLIKGQRVAELRMDPSAKTFFIHADRYFKSG